MDQSLLAHGFLEKSRMMTKFATFGVMLAFWVLLSGMFDFFHLTLGVLSCALVANFSHELLFYDGRCRSWLQGLMGIVGYLPWLIWQVLVANVQIAYIVLHPRMLELIDPQMIRFRTRLQRPFSKVTLGQSITLTPGTVTVSINDDEFTVYALTRAAAEELPGEMERRVARALEADLS